MSESAKAMTNPLAAEIFGEARRNWGWLLALGILFIVLGVIGLAMVVSMTMVGVLFFGWLLIIGGVFQLIEAFKVTGWRSVLWHVLMAIMYVLAGGIIVYDPVGGALALTAIIAASLLVIGVLRIIIAFQLKGVSGWWWPLIGGLISILLGIMIISQWPSSAFWVIGMFISIELIVNGWSYVMVALSARQALKALA